MKRSEVGHMLFHGEEWGLLLFGILVPFLGTTLGAASVFGIKRTMPPSGQRGLLGLSAGVMMAASVWSLILPATEMAEAGGSSAWATVLIGFLAGVSTLMLPESIATRLQKAADASMEEGRRHRLLIPAVTLHNLPEGMAVGVVLAGVIHGEGGTALPGALALALGIAIQNLPEGAIISLPLAAEGMKKAKAFGWGVASGAVEPLGTIVTLFLTAWLTPLLPYVLAFAAGAMIYVVLEELLPEIGGDFCGNICTVLGFSLMMVLDIALG